MSPPILVAGGGLAGAAAAIRLARAGRRVILVERTTGPTHKVCGEFLSREAQADLAELGVDPLALGAHPITHLRVVRGAAAARIRLPFRGLGLSRYRLDEALLDRAAASGAAIRRGETFRLDGHGRDTLFLATGKHDVRGVPRRHTASVDRLVGFKSYFRLAPGQQRALAAHIELLMFPDGYAGLQLVEDGLANLCLLVDRARLDHMRLDHSGGAWPALLASLQQDSPHLADRLAGATEQLDRPLAIARTPFGFVHRPGRADPAHLFRLGDQAAVIPALTGDGMSIALHSAALASRIHLAGGDAALYHRTLHRDVAGQVRRATALYTAGTHPAGQRLLMGAAALLPASIRLLTTLTRVRQGALLSVPKPL